MTTTTGAPGPSSHGDRRVTITDVARAAGVSIAVVSYALNGRPGVSARTRRTVLRTAADLGWRPSAAARSLRSAPRSVAVQVLADAPTAAAVALAYGIQDALAPDGVRVPVEVSSDRETAARQLEDGWAERRHAAFVVTGVLHDDPRLRRAAQAGFPLVPVTPPAAAAPGTAPPWFDDDAEDRVGRYLADLGHRRVALLTHDAHDDVARALEAAIVAALRTAVGGAGASVDRLEYRSAEDAAAVAARLLATDDRPTAVVTDVDVPALAVLEAARRRGLEVPWDLSVVCATESAVGRLVHPPLTAVTRPWERLGARIANALLPHLPVASDAGPAEEDAIVPAKLVIRGSTAPAPA